MKKFLTPILFLLFVTSCTPSSKERDNKSTTDNNTPPPAATPVEQKTTQSDVPASQRVTLDDKGVGPIESIDIPSTVDQAMADRGKKLFELNCTICHKVEGDLIGPPLKGVMERRSPEWVMNMMLKPELMLRENQTAKDLLVEYKNSPMTNQSLTETQARELLEYMRTL